ncbi:MAG: copper(I)-binding protein [Oceanicoccus sp.]|jgi:copper(I)-binding protein
MIHLIEKALEKCDEIKLSEVCVRSLRNIVIGVIVCCLFGIGVRADVSIEEGYVRGLPPGQTVTAAFMRLKNDGDQSVVITGASSKSAERLEFHAHHHSGGMMSMKRVDNIVVPAKGVFDLKPGDHHLMLINLVGFLREGDSVDLILEMQSGETIALTLPVRSVLNEHKK